jgi:hypothetical protein
MDKLQPETGGAPQEPCPVDLARRLARYRRRVEAEGRQRSVRVIDRAIADVSDGPRGWSAKLPKGSS